MPYKLKEQAKEASKERMRKHRKGVTKGVTKQGVTVEGVTHPIMYALADPVKREKLTRVCQALGKRDLLGEVYYGTRRPVPMSQVAEMLGVLR